MPQCRSRPCRVLKGPKGSGKLPVLPTRAHTTRALLHAQRAHPSLMSCMPCQAVPPLLHARPVPLLRVTTSISIHTCVDPSPTPSSIAPSNIFLRGTALNTPLYSATPAAALGADKHTCSCPLPACTGPTLPEPHSWCRHRATC
jgi:hypothetical protein